jgi:hypothetical protein
VGNGFCLALLFDLVLVSSGQLRGLPSSGFFWNPLEVFFWMVAIGLLGRIFARRMEAMLGGIQQEAIPARFPAFPQGIVPVTATDSLLYFFFTLTLVFPDRQEALPSPLLWLSATTLMTALSFGTFHLFSSRKRLAWNLPSGALPAEGDLWTGRSLAQSTAVLVFLGAGLLGGYWFLNFQFAGIMGFAGLAMLVAAGCDIVGELTFRRTHEDKVEPVMELDNVYGACYLEGLLAKNGIHCLVRSFHFRSLTFFFEPIVKMELIVPNADFEQAREIISLARIEIV